MAQPKWKLNVKTLTGRLEQVEVNDPKNTTVLQLKTRIHEQLSSLNAEVFLQKLMLDSQMLEDPKLLTSYPSLGDGATLMLILKAPYELYIQDTQHKMHTITIPSSTPESYTIKELCVLVEKKLEIRMNDCKFQFNDQLLEESRDGKQQTLEDYGLKKEDSLIMTGGFPIKISEAEVDICFMMDCTGSMGSYIEAVKTNVKQIREYLIGKFKGCDIRFAFVRYTDYDQPESTRTTYLDFTSGLSEFIGFVDPIKARGGGDGPEDIMGALKVTFSKLSWRPCSKVLIHIADAPCHGTQYHNMSDNYPGGDPAGITHDQMMREVNRLDIQYWFGYVEKNTTDKMIGIFNESLKSASNQRLLIKQFDIKDPKTVGDAVFKAAVASMYSTAARKA